MKKSSLILLCTLYLGADITFEAWQEQEAQSFQTIQSNEDMAFMKYLQEWEWYKQGKSLILYTKPKPQIQPLLKPLLNQKHSIVIGKATKPFVQNIPRIREPILTKDFRSINIDFFGDSVIFTYPKQMGYELKVVSKVTIADFWRQITQQNYKIVVERIKLYKKTYHLNGWATYLLIHKISQQITQEANTQTALKWFLLIKMGIDVKVGISQKQLILMVHGSNLIYATRYFILNHKHYFILDDSVSTTKLQIYKRGNSNLLALDFMGQPLLKQSRKERIVQFTFQNKLYKIPFYYNQNLINFYQTYPQIDYNYYTNNVVLTKALKPLIDKMNQLNAINFLLRLTQNGFKYKRDHAQFGKEKVMFFEETLAYPYSDCEDRAIFFTQLVKSLLSVEIIFIKYPHHLATAIAINSNIKGETITYQDKKFYIADPTYGGSNIGQAMPQLQGQKIKIIEP